MKAHLLGAAVGIFAIGIAVLAAADSRPLRETAEITGSALEPETVWTNPPARTYYCAGDKRHGRTEGGAYLAEVEANARGLAPAQGQACR